ncbi:MAG TPA: hypothetical protein VMU26_27170 [Candidatus Polarisedimenticolia bacterium]|nr:hypothetical protein [Candidatus Polarisedimenticolia bacterium]
MVTVVRRICHVKITDRRFENMWCNPGCSGRASCLGSFHCINNLIDLQKGHRDLPIQRETGELRERRRQHPEEAEKFYRELAAQGMKARMGVEASGHALV